MAIDWDRLVVGPTTDKFGESFLLSDAAGEPILGADGLQMSVMGVFDDAYKRDLILETGSLEWTITAPVLGVQLSQFGSMLPVQDELFTRVKTGVVYRMIDSRPDSHGASKLILGKA